MRSALVVNQAGEATSSWALPLPGMCCQAAGGEPSWAEAVAAAWFLLYAAAHTLDNVADGDAPEAWWAELGPGAALNTATGLIFSASQALHALYDEPHTRPIAREIVDDFHRAMFTICGGQQRDLLEKEIGLQAWWEVAAAKSGAAFALACRAGARVATSDAKVYEGLSRFGHHLGLLVQVLDDVHDLFGAETTADSLAPGSLAGSLSVAYALEVLPAPAAAMLRARLREAASDGQALGEVVSLLESSGAALYVETAIERQQRQALTALEAAVPPSEARDQLAGLLAGLV